ncbi:hypothetical protein HNV28_26285 [Myxococcus xanthus]|uniref:Beta-ketoacyl synthase N-terminal domain-containing protein n=1 Tax=Myxococcus xanthus TaxID=34 RepID=A0A7Y4IMZ0_MYXXA|nr:hypothetical protein [Myxococcus xanthus]
MGDAEDASPSTEPVRLAYLEPLLEALQLPIEERNAEVLCLGHAGALHAIHQAKHWMESHGLERLIVVAVDSYCEPLTLEWLAGHRRLKTLTNPCGLMPGEAGACFLLESTLSARRRQPPMQVGVSSAAVREEHADPGQGGRNPGDVLAGCLAESLAGDIAGGAFGGSLVLDLNGENWRSSEWGYARVRLRDYLRDDVQLMLPATSVGDTGAASGAVNVCVAIRALARGYARSDKVLVASSSERGHVGSAFFKRLER